MDAAPPHCCCCCSMTEYQAHVSRIYVFLHLWWRFYSVINPCMPCMHACTCVCVCMCVMGPRSGNLVDSGASRLSPCQMQQILFQYQAPAGVIWKHGRSTYISSEVHFCAVSSKCKVNWLWSFGGRIYSKLDNVFHVSYCMRITFLKKINK